MIRLAPFPYMPCHLGREAPGFRYRVIERLWYRAGIRQAVEQALAAGGSDVGLIRYLLKAPELEHRVAGEALDVGWLRRYERPQPNLHDYDQLLAHGLTEVIQ
jgi:hypothetical protein